MSLKQARHTTLNISHGSERIDEQIVDLSLKTEISLEAVLASAAASKNSWAQVTTDREVSVKTLEEESTELASVTRVLQLDTGGAEGQTSSLFRQSSSIGSETSTHPAGSEVMTIVRRLAEKEHSAALDRLTSSISAIMKLGAGNDENPFATVESLTSDLSDKLQETPSEVRDTSYRDERTSKATEKKENLYADTAKHSSTLVSSSTTLHSEISTLQSELSALSNRQLHTDTMRADFAIDHETVARCVVSNIRFEYFIEEQC